MKGLFSIALALVLLSACLSAGFAEEVPPDMGYQLLKPIYEQQGQFVCSPLSLKLALAMAAEGASGETRAQLLTLLNTQEPLSPDLGGYEQLKSANAAIISDKIQLTDAYQKLLQDKYQAALLPMAEDVLAQVNAWTDEHTDGLIPELLTQQPGEDLRLVLLNALALSADWQIPFDPDLTEDGTFHAADGDVTAAFMNTTHGALYAEMNGTQAVILPYDDDKLEMVLVLPEQGGLNDVLEQMAGGGLSFFGDFAYISEVRLSLPKLNLSSSLEFKPVLTALGITDAFSMGADFSGMTGNTELYIDDVLQRVRMDVDEQGTVAAAVTGIMIAAKGLALESVDMVLDRPFIALVRTADTGELAFAAVVENPTIS